MKKRLLYLFTCMYLLLPFHIQGEEGFSQALKISLTGKIYKNLSFTVEEDLRSAIDFSQLQWLLGTAELNYKIHPRIKAGVAYMHLLNLYDNTQHRHRYLLYVTAKQPCGSFVFSVRERSRARMPNIKSNRPVICGPCLLCNITFRNLIFIPLYMPRHSTILIGEVWRSTAFVCRPDAIIG